MSGARSAALALAVAASAGCTADLTSREARSLVDQGAWLVDVRERYEFDEGHLPGAVNLPISVFKQQMNRLPRDRDLLVHCHTGLRAAVAVGWLREAGFTRVRFLATLARWHDDPDRAATPFD